MLIHACILGALTSLWPINGILRNYILIATVHCVYCIAGYFPMVQKFPKWACELGKFIMGKVFKEFASFKYFEIKDSVISQIVIVSRSL